MIIVTIMKSNLSNCRVFTPEHYTENLEQEQFRKVPKLVESNLGPSHLTLLIGVSPRSNKLRVEESSENVFSKSKGPFFSKIRGTRRRCTANAAPLAVKKRTIFLC